VEALALAPDGRTLYAAASTKSSVAAFLADSPAGAFTFLDVQKDGVGTIDGLSGASALAVSPDGVYLYVAGTKANAVTTFSTRCGDGRLDAGEQCDDGNSADGDGCSGGCRKECDTATDCDDGDRCTVDLCRGGECAMPECGLRGAICELGRAVPAMRTVPECLPLSRQLGGTIRAHLGLARQAVQLALHPPVKVGKSGKVKKPKKVSPKKVNAAVGKILSAVELKATKLQQRGRISDACLAAVQSSTEALRGEIGVSVLGKGLCAP
jgi:cysteine-rich repeat protein